MEETVTISKKEYYSLMRDSFRYHTLESYGVNNWSGYEYAQKEWREEEEE